MIGFTISTTIYGIPCQAEITYYEPNIPDGSYLTSSDPQPGHSEVIEFQLLSEYGNPGFSGDELPDELRLRITEELSQALKQYHLDV